MTRPVLFGQNYKYSMSEQRLHQPTQFPETTTEFTLEGPAGLLECVSDVPEEEVKQPAYVVICHPHPQHAGTMRNKVVTILERSLRELGLATIRFNFRGVGDSEGEYDEGHGEFQDLLAVNAWARQCLPDHELWLAGFSFGSWISARAAQTLEPRQLISIAPPVERLGFENIQVPGCHWLIIQGEDDDVVNAQAVRDWAEDIDPAPQLLVMPDAGHFFHRRLMDLRGLLKNKLKEHLPIPIQ